MQRSFADIVDDLWHVIRDNTALTALLLHLSQLDAQRPPPPTAAPAVNPWFPPLLFRCLTPEELSCVLPLPCAGAPPSSVALAAALLRAILLPMRAKLLNEEVTMQVVDALGYSMDASCGVLAMLSGVLMLLLLLLLLMPFTTTGDSNDLEQGFLQPPHTPGWTRGLFAWTVATALEQRQRPCSLSECLRLLRRDDLSLLQHVVAHAPQPSHALQALPAAPPLPSLPPCCLCLDGPSIVSPCSRPDGSHSLCGPCAVQSLRFALSQV